MGRVLILLLCLFSGGRAYALDIAKPPGGVEAFLPDYGVRVAVVVIRLGALGEAIAILEKKANSELWYLCGNCAPIPRDNLASEIAFKGGVLQLIESDRPAINAIFKLRYPPIIVPTQPTPLPPNATPAEQINNALLQGYKIDAGGFSPK